MPQLNLPAFLAQRLRASGEALYAAGAKMPPERLSWHPVTEGNTGRDAADQLAECAYLNNWAAGAFRAGSLPAFDKDAYKAQTQALTSSGEALTQLQQGTENLAAAVEAFPAEKLGETFTNPLTQAPSTWAEFAHFFYWNNVYHEGQVNYIQVLYGDMS